MSKKFQTIGRILGCLGLILQFFTFLQAQDVEVTIKASVGERSVADIQATLLPENTLPGSGNIWFLDEYAGTAGLTKRLSKVDVHDRQGVLLESRQFSASDQFNARSVGSLIYSVDLVPNAKASAAAHVSWLTQDGGILMLDDLLPQMIGKTAKVRIEVPLGWKVYTTEKELGLNLFSVSNLEKAIFYTGPNFRSHRVKFNGSTVGITLSGEWHYSDAEAIELTALIYDGYKNKLGETSSLEPEIFISKFPIPSRAGIWEAETRGRSVTIISSDTTFKTQSKQRLHEQLRHELFHLWIPNGVNLSGNYDWFYEGFALYQSLRVGVDTNTISFDNFLDTLSRAYSVDSMQAMRTSLIEASKNRFGGANTTVYARGMLVAFICDIALLDRSKGKRSVENFLRDIYQKHHNSPDRVDGNAAVLAEFAKYPELKEIVDRYIKAGETIDIAAYARVAGIDITDQNGIKRLAVLPKPNSRQKDLLDKLGYNSWRRLSKDNR